MNTEEYGNFDAVALADLLDRREVSATELLDCALALTERFNPVLNAITVPAFDQARRQAADLDKSSRSAKPLAGVPFLIKDLSEVSGLPQTNHSRLFAGEIAQRSSMISERFLNAELVMLGKTNTPELCLTITTESVFAGPCRNPWNLDYSTGGSSGGAAAAVAAGIVPAAHATDGGGSIRIPASCCGLFGLKPSRGLTPVENNMQSSWSGMSVAHVVTRSVRDSAAFLDLLALDTPSLYPLPPGPGSFLESGRREPGALRIAVQTEHPGGAAVDPDCTEAVNKAMNLCGKLGHDVELCAPPVDYSALAAAAGTVINVHVAQAVMPRLENLGLNLEDSPLEEATRRMAARGARTSATEYLVALDYFRQVSRDMEAFHQTHDVLLSPVLALPPARLGWLDMNSSSIGTYARRFSQYSGFAALMNVSGQPSMSVPLHINAAGLPVGAMFSAGWSKDLQLLQLATMLESAAPWGHLRPPAP
ncbi:MAG: amidase family protein [Pseudohongiellaceae bacterium]